MHSECELKSRKELKAFLGFKPRFLSITVDKEFEKVKELLQKLSVLDIDDIGSDADSGPFVALY